MTFNQLIKQRIYNTYSRFIALSIYRRIGIVLGLLFFFLISFILLLKVLVSTGAFGALPDKEQLRNIRNPIASEIFAHNGELIGRYYVENRSQLNPEDLNQAYKNALVATEDARFYSHNGVDYRSLLRVFFKTILLQKGSSGGGSTLTQQLVKNLFPRKRYKFCGTVINKFREMSIAKRMEEVYSKEEILLLYSNTVSFGERAFGLSVATRRFFNKEPLELTVSEAATLVGMLKATSYYSPRNYPERAKRRRNTVLNQMVKYNYLSQADTVGLLDVPVTLDYTPLSAEEEFAKYFKQYLSKQLKTWMDTTVIDSVKQYKLSYDGLKVYTSIDYDMQVAAETIMKRHMTSLQKIFLDSWKGGRLYGKDNKLIDEKILSDPYYKSLIDKGLSNKEAVQKFSTKTERQIWTWESGFTKQKITKIDSIKNYLSLLHTGILGVEPASGKVKVWVGGNDYGSFQYDNVTSPRQVGSLFKPIVYLAALEKGKTPCDFYKNELRNYTSYQDWTPHNADETYGGYMSMRGALTHSVNTVSVQVLFDAGVDKVVDMAERLGVKSRLSAVPSIVLGTSDVSLFDMVTAYSTLANNGRRQEISCIERIEDKDGNILYSAPEIVEDTTAFVVDTSYSRQINAILENVVSQGTGRRLYSNYSIPSTVRGKTGTTQNQSDGWFIGYTDDLVLGSWVGTKDRRIHFRNLGTGSGGRTALPMVGALFEFALNKNKIPSQAATDITFECPDVLTDEEYVSYTTREERIVKTRKIFGGWLNDILNGRDPKKKKTNRDNYKDLNTKQRLEQIELDKKKWNRRLKRKRRK